jgi:hypothetical protein
MKTSFDVSFTARSEERQASHAVTTNPRERHPPPEVRPPGTRVVDSDSADSEQAPLLVKEQKRAPCTEGIEIELSGACWHSLRQRPPVCPRLTMTYKGECFLPVVKAYPIPTSVDARSAQRLNRVAALT